MNKPVVFLNGLPYGPDLRKLNEVFPVSKLTEGTIITYDELQQACGYQYGSSRFYALIKSWMGHQRDENRIFMIFESKTGVKVLDPAQIMEHGERRVRQKITQTGRAVRIFSWVDRDRLDDVGKRRLDHQARVVSLLKDSLDTAKKQLAIELAPVKSLPRPGVK